MSVADSHGPSAATIHRTVHRVTQAIIGAFAGVVRWPADVAEITAIKQRFFNQAGIPDVVGESRVRTAITVMATICILIFICVCSSDVDYHYNEHTLAY